VIPTANMKQKSGIKTAWDNEANIILTIEPFF